MSYQITIQPSGRIIHANAGERVLDAALRQGVELPYSCRSGECASCIARLLAGEVTYDEYYPALDALDEGEALLCQAQARTDLVIEAEADSLEEAHRCPRTLPCKVVRKEPLCHDVMGVWLKLPEARPLHFRAGQYLDVLTEEGRRSFSIANAPEDGRILELHIRRVEGGEFTDYVFENLREKAIWRIEAPLGTFYLREDGDRPILLMGGGTGFAPLKGMLEHAFGAGLQRSMHLFWGVRARPDLYLAELPERWLREHPNFRYTPVLSEPRPEDHWQGETGLLHEALLRRYPELGAYDIYMSGPPVMVQAAGEAFLRHGARADRLFADAFEFNRLISAA